MRVNDVERGEASAASDGKASELDQPAAAGVCGIEVLERECLQRMTLKGELLQRRLLQVVLVAEILNCQVLQALLVANSASKVFEDCADSFRGRAHEKLNLDVFRRSFLLSDPFTDSVGVILRETTVHLHLVQLDIAPLDVHGDLRDAFSFGQLL